MISAFREWTHGIYVMLHSSPAESLLQGVASHSTPAESLLRGVASRSFLMRLRLILRWTLLLWGLLGIGGLLSMGWCRSTQTLLDRLETCHPKDWALVRLDRERLCWYFFPDSEGVWIYETTLDPDAPLEPPPLTSAASWERFRLRRTSSPQQHQDEQADLLQQLFGLSWQELPLEKQRKRGPPPRNGLPDQRSIWRPLLARSDSHCQVLEAAWPADGSELEHCHLVAYLPSSQSPHLHYLPYYVEIEKVGVRRSFELLKSGQAIPPAHLDKLTQPKATAL